MTRHEFRDADGRLIVLSFVEDILTTEFHLVEGQAPSVLRTRGRESNEVINALRQVKS